MKKPGYNFQQAVDKKLNKFISLTGSDSAFGKLIFTTDLLNFGINNFLYTLKTL